MLEDAAIHVDDVDRPVRPGGQVDRPEALVGGDQELAAAVLRGVGVAARDAPILLLQLAEVHHVAAWLADEGAAAEAFGEARAAVDQRAADPGPGAQAPVLAQRPLAIGAVDAEVQAPGEAGGVLTDLARTSLRLAERGVAAQIVHRHQVGVERPGVVVVVGAAPVVDRQAPLAGADAAARLGLERAAAPAIAAPVLGHVQPAVEAEEETVGLVFGVAEAGVVALGDQAAGVPLVSRVGDQVAVRVRHEPQFGAGEHQHTAADQRQRARHHQPVEEGRAAIHRTVAVVVVQHRDLADRLLLAVAVDVGHEAAHLDHPQPSLAVEHREHRVDHQRFGGDQLDAEAVGDGEAGELLLRAQRRRGGDVVSLPHLALLLTGLVAILRSEPGAGPQREAQGEEEGTAAHRNETIAA